MYHFLRCKMLVKYGQHFWHILTNTGIQQGAPASAGLFAIIIGECLDELFSQWSSTGSVKARHVDEQGNPLHGWAFADDCTLNFRGWDDFKIGFQSLVSAFHELGLSINFGKTVVVVHPSMWEQGVAFFRDDPEHCGFRCQWASEGTYLRRPFKHYLGAFSISDWAVKQARTLSFSGWESLAAPLRCCSWNCSGMAIQLLNRYVFSKWAWFAPLLEPLQRITDDVLSMQVTLLLLLLRLYIPTSFQQRHAVLVNRQRRRAVRHFLALLPLKQWTFLMVRRKWSYLGHCLRRPAASLERAALAATDAQRYKQSKPAPGIMPAAFCSRLVSNLIGYLLGQLRLRSS